MISNVARGIWSIAIGLSALSADACAFDLQTLSQTLSNSQLSTGHFVQERQLEGFPKPLRTEGVYFLDLKKGIVWETVKPFANTIIFSENGVKNINKNSSRVIPAKDIPYLETVNSLILALFSAQTQTLEKDFEIRLKGSPSHWTMTLISKQTSVLTTVFKEMEVSGGKTPETIKIINRQNETTSLYLSNQKKLFHWPDRLEPL